MDHCVACKKSQSVCDCFSPQYRFIPEYKKNTPGRAMGDGKRSKRPIHLLKKHGLTGYADYGCRCHICLHTWQAYNKASYAKKKARKNN